jgi:simple sugar transport system substrate-binding protein
MKKKHITLKRMAALALVLLSSAFTTQVRAEEQEIAVVVKIGGIPWFTAMEKGIKEAGKEQNV